MSGTGTKLFHALCVLVGILALGAATASAAVTHSFLPNVTAKLNEGVPSQGPHGEPVPLPGPFNNIDSMTVDSGELYVADGRNDGTYRLDKFNAESGDFALQFAQVPTLSYLSQGVSVRRATGEVYVGGDASGTTEGVVAAFDSTGQHQPGHDLTGTPEGAFGCIRCGIAQEIVATDNSSGLRWSAGDVYVIDESHDLVDVFKPEAGGLAYATHLTGTEAGVAFSRPVGVAVNQQNGEVFVLDGSGEKTTLDLFKPSAVENQYEFAGTLAPPAGSFKPAFGLAVDGGNGDLYVAETETGVVDEFVLKSGGEYEYVGALTGTPAGAFNHVNGLAVDPLSHDLYVSSHSAVDVFGGDLVLPDPLTGATTSLGVRSVTLTGTVNPNEAGPASCQFVWGTTSEFGSSAPCSETVAQGSAPVAVQAALNSLQPDTTYCYRLVASNANGTNRGEVSQNHCFTTLGPGLHGQSASSVTAESATLDATINPHNTPATYQFQYGVTSGYGLTAPSASSAALASQEGDVAVAEHLQGLAPAVTYHYRVVVFSEPSPGHPEEFDGPDATFTTERQGSDLTAPDGRQWELVTPAQKQGAVFRQIYEGPIQAAAAGNAMVDLARTPSETEPQGNSNAVSVLSTRGPDGWSSQVIAPPHTEAVGVSIAEGQEYRFFSEDLSRGIVQPLGHFTPLSPDATEATADLRTDYLNGNVNEHCQSGCYTPLVTAANTPPGTKFGEPGSVLGGTPHENEGCAHFGCGPYALAATPDLSHVVLSSPARLTADAPSGGLYEWSAGKLTFVGAGSLGDIYLHPFESRLHVISNDGSLIFFEGESEGLSGLLVRNTVTGKTTRIGEGEFMAASSDGARAFFIHGDLYEYRLNAAPGNQLTDLTTQHQAGETAEVARVLGTSEDGSYVYFAAAGALTPNAEHGRCNPGPGQAIGSSPCNLYVLHSGITTLIGALSNEDESDWAERLALMTARVSQNGRWLAFMSGRNLTGYDTRDAFSGKPDQEVYLYDAEANKLICASCDPTGALPVGVNFPANEYGVLAAAYGIWPERLSIAANLPPWNTIRQLSEPSHQPRYLSNSGRLFFNTDGALVPQDVNGTQDVYQYEPAGVGSCDSESPTFAGQSDGCVGMISSGNSPEESVFLDASESGGDVFFLTLALLAPEDFDNALDVYDAHECTKQSPCLPSVAASPPPCATGDACKAAPTPQPSIFGATSSATFSGAGNLARATRPAPATPRALTRAQKLARALKLCKKKAKKQRATCSRRARQKYGAGKRAGVKPKTGRR